MDNLQEIKAYATTLSLVHTKNELEHLIHEAESKKNKGGRFSISKIFKGFRFEFLPVHNPETVESVIGA